MENRIDYPPVRIKKSAYTEEEGNDLHFGRVLEKVIRRSPVGISELGRRLGVSRRTVYNWFESRRVNIEIVRKIGFIIGHDFSVDFPEEFAKSNEYAGNDLFPENQNAAAKPNDAVYYWMDKYIKLLEKFNSALSVDTKIKIDMMIVFIFAMLNAETKVMAMIENSWM